MVRETSIEGQDLTNRYVLIDAESLAPQYRDLSNRLFFCEAGFGCSPVTSGTAVFGTHPFDGEKTRWERYHFERFATQEEIDLVLAEKVNGLQEED